MPFPGGLATSAGSNGAASWRGGASWAPLLTSNTNAVLVIVNT